MQARHDGRPPLWVVGYAPTTTGFRIDADFIGASAMRHVVRLEDDGTCGTFWTTP